jgi:hypothetical protein
MTTQRVAVEVGPVVGRLLTDLELELSPAAYRHVMRQALLNAALRYSNRINLDRAGEVAALEEIAEQLKAGA